MSSRHREKKGRIDGSIVAALVTFGAAFIVITCSTTRRPVEPEPPKPASAVPSSEVTAPISSDVPPPPPPGVRDRSPGHELDGFYEGLRALEARTRKEHVRVVWLGDSHGASDLWSGPVRDALQTRFGDGGPGFVHLGYKTYRHDHVRLEVKGPWSLHPRGPASPPKEGFFGFGGMLFAGSGAGARTSLTVNDPGLPPPLRWELCYRLDKPQDELVVGLPGVADTSLKLAPGDAPGVFRYQTFHTSDPGAVLRVTPTGGKPFLCGVFVETDPATHPGVILDQLGVNGARLTTALAWNEHTWGAELARRRPSLLILEFGTNEASDSTVDDALYLKRVQRLVTRARTAAPDSDCLVLAPTDRADTPVTIPLVRDALRAAASTLGCQFWDTYSEMGGAGAINTWRSENPPRAAPDGVHLMPVGYRALGTKLAEAVLAGYR